LDWKAPEGAYAAQDGAHHRALRGGGGGVGVT